MQFENAVRDSELRRVSPGSCLRSRADNKEMIAAGNREIYLSAATIERRVDNMIYRVKTKKALSEVTRDLEGATQRHKFGIMGTYDLKARMKEKGVEFNRECLIFEICNPHQAKKVLEKNADISTALPCRISVYQEGNEVVLATLKPTAMLALFESEGLGSVAREVEDEIFAIMQESSG